jgi:hypothetical protein
VNHEVALFVNWGGNAMRLKYRYVRHIAEIATTGRVTPVQSQYLVRKSLKKARKAAHHHEPVARVPRPPAPPRIKPSVRRPFDREKANQDMKRAIAKARGEA